MAAAVRVTGFGLTILLLRVKRLSLTFGPESAATRRGRIQALLSRDAHSAAFGPPSPSEAQSRVVRKAIRERAHRFNEVSNYTESGYGLVLRSCPQSRGLGFRRMNAPAFRSAARPGSRRAFQRSHAWITCGQTSGVTGTSAAPAVPASRRPSAEPTWISIGGSPLKSA